ncbi:MAG TPA: hypothetical protein VFT13_07040 [Candidatus Krumholzibacteria bacterium]|nr:hypothetical protein [Candidatus Krumholzibacteria bacterium]
MPLSPEGGAKYQVTRRGGFNLGWSSDGRRLFFGDASDPRAAYAAEVMPGSLFRLGPARAALRASDDVFDADLEHGDGRLLMLVAAGKLPPQTIAVVQNWRSLLNKHWP